MVNIVPEPRLPKGVHIPFSMEAAAKAASCYRAEIFARVCSEIPRRLGRVDSRLLMQDKQFWKKVYYLYKRQKELWVEISKEENITVVIEDMEDPRNAKNVDAMNWARAKLTAALEDRTAVSARLEELGEPRLAKRVAHLYTREIEGLGRILSRQ